MPRPPSGKKSQRHAPLHHQIDPTVPLAYKKGKTDRIEIADDLTELKESRVTGKMSKKVIESIKQQRLEIQRSELDGHEDIDNDAHADMTRARLNDITPDNLLSGHYGDTDDEADLSTKQRQKFHHDDDDNDTGDEHDENDTTIFQHDEGALDLNADDRAMLEAFLPSSLSTKQTLTHDIITNADQRATTLSLGIKQAEKESDVQLKPAVPKDVIVTYQKIGAFLAKYRTGKLPKAFKVIPALRNWEEIMYYTNPASWTPQATNAATGIFANQLKPKHAQRFYSLILAPKVSSQLATEGRLGFHLYDSLKQSIYKPSAFFKGLILPIAAGYPAPPFPGQPQAPLSKEVIVYASVLNRMHLPPVHAAVTLLQMSKILPFNPYNVLLMKVLIDKKYALPIAVIEGLLAYFYETANSDEGLVDTLNPRTQKTTQSLPLLWHKCLLHFVERYKSAFSDEMIAVTRAILKQRPHHALTDEIRRELTGAGAAGASIAQAQQVIDTNMYDM
jgi:essential nuclear protein 1